MEVEDGEILDGSWLSEVGMYLEGTYRGCAPLSLSGEPHHWPATTNPTVPEAPQYGPAVQLNNREFPIASLNFIDATATTFARVSYPQHTKTDVEAPTTAHLRSALVNCRV